MNLIVESMNGLSEEDYNKASDIDVKTNLGVNSIAVKEQEFNNKKARVTYFVQKSQGTDIPTYQVTFLNNGKSYIFTISAVKKNFGWKYEVIWRYAKYSWISAVTKLLVNIKYF